MKPVKRFFKQLLGLLPSRLPQGMTEFNTWVNDIVDTYDLPTTDLDSIKFALATMIMHLDTADKNVVKSAHKPKYFFVLLLRISAAKQVSSQIFQEVKLKQQEAAKKAQEVPSNAQ